MNSISALEGVYRATAFEVDARPQSFVLRIDQRSVEVATTMRQHGVDSAAYVTAWNPRSEPTSQADNDTAHVRLVAWIADQGLAFVGGWGRDPTGQWPPEKSVLILGISREAALQVGRDFGQNAIVFIGPDATPRLEMLV